MNSKTLIRIATQDDLKSILNLVKQLAVFEKEPEAVKTKLSDYETAFKDGLFKSHVAILNDKIIGMTLYYFGFSTWKGKMLYLEDFIVDEEFRKKGIGILLFKALLAEAKKQKCKITRWQVLDWNEDAVNFYLKQGAEIEENWWNCKIELP